MVEPSVTFAKLGRLNGKLSFERPLLRLRGGGVVGADAAEGFKMKKVKRNRHDSVKNLIPPNLTESSNYDEASAKKMACSSNDYTL